MTRFSIRGGFLNLLYEPHVMKFNREFKKYGKVFANLGAFIAVTAWALSFLSTKVLMEDGGFTPIEMYVYRFAVAYILLLILTLRNVKSNSWKDELTLAICGICSGTLYFITENYALRLTTAGNVSLLTSISPIFTTFLVALIFRQRLQLGVVLGSLVAIVGVGCIIFSHGEGIEFRPEGDLLALSAALSWALYSVAVKRVLPLYSSLFITRKLFFYGVITALPLLFLSEGELHFLELFDFRNHPEYFLNFSFLVLMCSVLAYLIWNSSMKFIGPVTTNNYMYLQPLITMIAAYFLLGENITILGYLGCFLIISGLVVSDKWKPAIRKNQR